MMVRTCFTPEVARATVTMMVLPAREHDHSFSAAFSDHCTHQGNIAGFREIVARRVDRVLDLAQFSSKNRRIKSNIAGGRDESNIGRYLIADANADDITDNEVAG